MLFFSRGTPLSFPSRAFMRVHYAWIIAVLVLLTVSLAAQDQTGGETEGVTAPTNTAPKDGTDQKSDTVGAPGEVSPQNRTGEKPEEIVEPADRPPQDADATSQPYPIVTKPPLREIDELALETAGHIRKFLTPSIGFSQSAIDNQTGAQGSSSSTNGLSRVFGTVSMERKWNVYDTSLAYVGSALFNWRDDQRNGQVHLLTGGQKITGRRAQFQIMDSLSYSPESSFGAQAFGGVGALQSIMGGTLTGELNTGFNVFNPNFGGLSLSNRISNMALVEGQYAVSRRTSLTAAGSYGLLHFLDNDGVGSHQGNIELGYNYTLNQRGTFALLYSGAAFRFQGIGGSFDASILYAVYGYRPSRRLNIKVGAGPEMITTRNSGPGVNDRYSWSGLGSIQYGLRRTILRLRLERFINNGSGVFLGAQSNFARADIDRSLSHAWEGSFNFGFAHSTRIQPAPPTTGAPSSALPLPLQSNSTVANLSYIGVRVAHKWGQNAGIFFNYQFDYQNSNSPICTTSSGCVRSTHQQEAQIGFNWHSHPLRID